MKLISNRKYGFNVYNEHPEDLVEYAYVNGLKHIEVHLSKDKFTLEMLTKERIDALSILLEKHKISISLHIPHYINISDIITPIRNKDINYLLKCINVASQLNATHITLHAGKYFWFPVNNLMRNNALKRFVNSIKKILPICETKGLIIALENVVPIPSGTEFYLLGDSIEDFKFIFSEINSNYLKFCLDTGHANMAEGVLDYLNQLDNKLCCIHYHDNNGLNDEHQSVGKGNISWNHFAKELESRNFTGELISECRNITPLEAALQFDKYFNSEQ